MVDRIDKPDAPPSYMVKSPTETKKDKPKEQKGQEDLPTFQHSKQSLYQEKFQGSSDALKTIQVPIAEIRKLVFHRATPHLGVPTAVADLVWKDGKVLEGASFLLRNWQDFLKIKNLKPGEPIPEPYWNFRGEVLEVTLRQKIQTSGSINLKELERGTPPPPTQLPPLNFWQRCARNCGLIDPKTGSLKPLGVILLSLGVVAVLATALILAARI